MTCYGKVHTILKANFFHFATDRVLSFEFWVLSKLYKIDYKYDYR